jgi:hypothetical protein
MTTKILLWVCSAFSVLTIFFGIDLIVVASISTQHTAFLQHWWKQMFGLSIYSIVIGVFALVLAGSYLYVVQRRFPAFITLFSFSSTVTALLAAVCAMILVTGRADLQNDSFNKTTALFFNYSQSNSPVNSNLVLSRIQQSFACCGIGQATDWQRMIPGNTTVPDSCCRVMTANCGKDALINEGRIYLRGCVEPIVARFRKSYTSLITINVIIMALSLASTVAGLVFQGSLEQEYQAM